ncbi:MAG: SDR family oxidoreductase [Burkholderiaceae bacterium]|nr:SDR family oxidoreductase [Burkholderiaceae bacterium]
MTQNAQAAGRGRLDGLVAFVTGASRGIGEAIARAYAHEGASICLAATDAKRLAEVESGLGVPAARAMTVALDVGDGDAVHAAVAACEQRFGRIDVLVNSAGVYKPASFLDYDIDDFERLIRVNLYGTIHTMQATLAGMQQRGFGRIVNIASTAGKWASRNQSAYNVSKHAVVGLTRCVALEAAGTGVTVNAICPGFVKTDMLNNLFDGQAQASSVSADAAIAGALARVPIGRMLEPREIADLAVHLATREAGGMTGQSVLVDGGMLFV